MDEATVRQYADAHAQSIKNGDMQAAIADIDPAVLPSLGALASQLPNPVTAAAVQSVEVSGDKATVRIKYDGADKSTTVQSEWQQQGDRPKLTSAHVV